MQYLKHNSTTQAIKPQNAEAVSRAILNVKVPSRRNIAEYAGITEMTVCRAISRLSDSGFIQENTSKNQISTVSISDNLKFIIADLTDNEYAIYLLSSNHKIIEQLFYTYNHSLDAEDNLSIFFERAKAIFSKKATHFSGIGIIFGSHTAHQKEKAVNIANQSFVFPFTLTLNINNCLLSLKESAILSHLPAERMYYLCLGNRNFAYYLYDDLVIQSNPKILIEKDGKPLYEKIDLCVNPETLSDILFSIINSASAMLDAKLFLVESDRFILGHNVASTISEKLKINFKDGRKLLITDSKPNYYIKGAAIALQKEIMKRILSK